MAIHPTILALDIATHCGWAARGRSGNLASGTWELDVEAREWSLWSRLEMVVKPDVLVVERPIAYGYRTSTARGTIVTLPLIGVARLYGQQMVGRYYEISPATLKKHMTGSGRASKDEVRSAVSLRLGIPVTDSDQADALALLYTWEDNHG